MKNNLNKNYVILKNLIRESGTFLSANQLEILTNINPKEVSRIIRRMQEKGNHEIFMLNNYGYIYFENATFEQKCLIYKAITNKKDKLFNEYLHYKKMSDFLEKEIYEN